VKPSMVSLGEMEV